VARIVTAEASPREPTARTAAGASMLVLKIAATRDGINSSAAVISRLSGLGRCVLLEELPVVKEPTAVSDGAAKEVLVAATEGTAAEGLAAAEEEAPKEGPAANGGAPEELLMVTEGAAFCGLGRCVLLVAATPGPDKAATAARSSSLLSGSSKPNAPGVPWPCVRAPARL